MFSEDQIQRYSRHILLPEIGGKGQERLLNSRVLLLGAGGLGSPTAYYLAAAGVGTIGLCDPDVVDLSNLQRQILHGEADLDRPKVDSGAAKLQALNTDVQVNCHREGVTSDNALELFANYDLVVDGTDNFATRYMVADACKLAGKPLVHGSIFRFEGQVTVFLPNEGPCYRCLYPEAPPAGLVPSCHEAGVLGVLPGIIGAIQAAEAVKVLLGIGNPLVGRLLTYDALEMEFHVLKLHRDPACALCGDSPTITSLGEYDYSCGVAACPTA